MGGSVAAQAFHNRIAKPSDEREDAADENDEGDDEEMEIDSEDCDIIGFDGQTIDMGEAVAETMALAMAPYPRSADADSYLREAGVLSEEQASPFAVLQSLKDKKS